MHDLEKRIINFMQHIGIWYIIIVFFPLESCLENTNLSLSKSAIVEPRYNIKSSAKEKPSAELTPPATLTEIDKSEFEDSQKFPTNTSSNKEYASFWTEEQLNEKISEKIITVTNKEYNPTTDQTNGNIIRADRFQINQSIAKEQKESKLVREKKLQERTFTTRTTSYSVNFYKKDNLWRAKVKDVTGKGFDLPAHLSEGDINLLTSTIPATTGMIQIVLPTLFKSGYVYVGGLTGGMKDGQDSKKEQKEEINISAEEIVKILPKMGEFLDLIRKKEFNEEDTVKGLKCLKESSSKINNLIKIIEKKDSTKQYINSTSFYKSEVNTEAEYNENQILLVWDTYIVINCLKYFAASKYFEKKQHAEDEMETDQSKKEQDKEIQDFIIQNSLKNLCRKDQISLEKEAGLLLNQDNKLYKNCLDQSVSICSSVDKNTNQAFNLITHNLEVAIDQLLIWNNLQTDANNRITNHIILFPYHITNIHWTLGTLKLKINSDALTNATIEIYNPLPDHGGRKVSNEALDYIQQLIDSKFSNSKVKLSSLETKKIKQQNDGSSCGVISAENGKAFISSDNIDTLLIEIYPTGAEDLRTKQLVEVDRIDFFKAQRDDKRYYDPAYKLPDNYDDLKKSFLKDINSLPQDGKEYIWNFISSMDAQDPELVLAVKKIIQKNRKNFNSVLELFDTKNKEEFEFKDDHYNTLEKLLKDLKKLTPTEYKSNILNEDRNQGQNKDVHKKREENFKEAQEFFKTNKIKSFEYYLRAARDGHAESITKVLQFQEEAKKIFELAEKKLNDYVNSPKKDNKGLEEKQKLRNEAINLYKTAAYFNSKTAKEKLIKLNEQKRERYKNLDILSNQELSSVIDLEDEYNSDESYELHLSDLVVMNLDPDMAPSFIQWGGDLKSRDFNQFYGPLFKTPNIEDYEQTIMAIDLAQRGSHETAYCIAKRCKDYYFIMEVGGMGGDYVINKEDRVPTNPSILEEIERVVNKYKVRDIRIESNIDLSYVTKLEEYLIAKDILVKITGHHQIRQDTEDNKGKRKRIINFLKPLLEDHKIIIDQSALITDMKSNPKDNLHYKFFYQLKNMKQPPPVKKRKKSKQEAHDDSQLIVNPVLKRANTLDETPRLKYDDRIDAVVQAIKYLSTDKEKNQEEKNNPTNAIPGMMYSQGRVVKKDIQKAYDNLQEYINKNSKTSNTALLPVAKGLLGRLMVNHGGTIEENKKGEKLLQESSSYRSNLEQKSVNDNGYGLAKYTLANLYLKNKEKDKAFEYYKDVLKPSMYSKFEDGASVKARYKLAKIFSDKLLKEEVLKLLKESAEAGYTPAQLDLAKIYEIEENFEEAIIYYKQAAALSGLQNLYAVPGIFRPSKRALDRSSEAYYRLANIYYSSSKFQDYFEAHKNLLNFLEHERNESSLQYKMASYKLANIYFFGKGIKSKNLKLALIYYQKSEGLEDKDSKIQNRLKDIQKKIGEHSVNTKMAA